MSHTAPVHAAPSGASIASADAATEPVTAAASDHADHPPSPSCGYASLCGSDAEAAMLLQPLLQAQQLQPGPNQLQHSWLPPTSLILLFWAFLLLLQRKQNIYLTLHCMLQNKVTSGSDLYPMVCTASPLPALYTDCESSDSCAISHL